MRIGVLRYVLGFVILCNPLAAQCDVAVSGIVWDVIAGNQPRIVLAIPVFLIAILRFNPYFLHSKASLGCDKNCAFGCDIYPP